MFVKVRDRLVNTLSFGHGGLPLIAHGGFAGSSELWLHPFETLSRTRQVATYDHRGSGENPADPADISQEELIADLFAVMDALGFDCAIVAGESMGAGIVLRAALEHPERFLGLVLVDGSPIWERSRSAGFATALRTDFHGALQGFIQRCFPEPGVDHIKRWALDILTRSTPETAAALVEAMWGLDLVERLPSIQLPTLVIHGREDGVVPLAAGELMAARLPNARLVVIDGCGHVPTMTFPQRVVEEVEAFLATIAVPT
ncbi:MAG TPA: alpha/beta hydrolase [Candidatus Dormibacteraeota bacterium]|nr:alpha/beta hydrolase [Candidatus Dormibacteraeota bacterium]